MVLQNAVVLPLAILTSLDVLPPQLAQILRLAVFVMVLAYVGFIARTALKVSPITALGLVVMDVLLSALIDGIAASMEVVAAVPARHSRLSSSVFLAANSSSDRMPLSRSPARRSSTAKTSSARGVGCCCGRRVARGHCAVRHAVHCARARLRRARARRALLRPSAAPPFSALAETTARSATLTSPYWLVKLSEASPLCCWETPEMAWSRVS